MENIREDNGVIYAENNNMKAMENDTHWAMSQDVSEILRQAKEDRDIAAESVHKPSRTMRKFATIPDVVAFEVKEKFGINIHDPEIASDRQEMARFRMIIKQHYPLLLSN